ncbi:MAG: hypothetical protein IJY61_02605 [Candidatus Gastranaerophilales bacterium]|nr:hypothetical protein [Candidatus Gastranaerophilales bacterium]
MMNSVGISQGVYIAPKKVDGKTHSRKDELTSYRTVLNVASDNLCIAAQEGNKEAYELCTQIIDFTQAKIDSIIEQEDKHSYKKADVSSASIKSAIENTDMALDTVNKAVNTAAKTTGIVAGSKLSLIA